MYWQRNDLYWQKANNHQPNPERLDIARCLDNNFGRLPMDRSLSVSDNGAIAGRIAGHMPAEASSTSDNQKHELTSSPATRFMLSPPTRFPHMEVP